MYAKFSSTFKLSNENVNPLKIALIKRRKFCNIVDIKFLCVHAYKNVCAAIISHRKFYFFLLMFNNERKKKALTVQSHKCSYRRAHACKRDSYTRRITFY